MPHGDADDFFCYNVNDGSFHIGPNEGAILGCAEGVRVVENDAFKCRFICSWDKGDFGEYPAIFSHKPRKFVAVGAAISRHTAVDECGLVQRVFAWSLNWGALQCKPYKQVYAKQL